LVLKVLAKPLQPVSTAPVQSGPSPAMSRRQLVLAGLVVTAATALGTEVVRRLSQPSVQLMSRLKAGLPPPRSPKLAGG